MLLCNIICIRVIFENTNRLMRNTTLVYFRRGDRVAEGERLEGVCTLTGYRGFESPSLRFMKNIVCEY